MRVLKCRNAASRITFSRRFVQCLANCQYALRGFRKKLGLGFINCSYALLKSSTSCITQPELMMPNLRARFSSALSSGDSFFPCSLTKPRNAPGASVEIFDTAGHMVQMEKASDVNRKLLEFLS